MSTKTVAITDTIGTAGTMRVPAMMADDAYAKMFPETADPELKAELDASGAVRIRDVADEDMTEADWRAWWLAAQENGRPRTITILGATVSGIPPSGPRVPDAGFEATVTYRDVEEPVLIGTTWLGLVASVRAMIDSVGAREAMRRLTKATREYEKASRAADAARRDQYDAITTLRSYGATYADLAEASGLSRAQLDRIVNNR